MINSPHDPINPYYEEDGPKQKGLTVFEFASLEIYKEMVKSIDLTPKPFFFATVEINEEMLNEAIANQRRNNAIKVRQFAEDSMTLASIWIDRIMQGYKEENPDLYTQAEEVNDANS